MLAVFEDRLLVGFGFGPVRYLLLNADSAEKLWSRSLEGSREELIYQPAFSGDRVILGGTTGVSVVEVSIGRLVLFAGREGAFNIGIALPVPTARMPA